MLKKGTRFRFSGLLWRVAYVNASRAHVVAQVKETVTMGRDDKARTFTATRTRTLDISPQTDVRLLAELFP